jgi:hypothetical protein
VDTILPVDGASLKTGSPDAYNESVAAPNDWNVTGWPTAGAPLSHPTVIALSVATPFLSGAVLR